jgi:hypothetical protein
MGQRKDEELQRFILVAGSVLVLGVLLYARSKASSHVRHVGSSCSRNAAGLTSSATCHVPLSPRRSVCVSPICRLK